MADNALDLNTYIYLHNSKPLGELHFPEYEPRTVEGSRIFMGLTHSKWHP